MKEMSNLSLRLALICALAALALSQVDALTRGPIAAAEARARRDAVEAVLPAFATLAEDTLGTAEAPVSYFVGRDVAGPTGVAFTAVSGLGYSGEIEVMVGVDPGGVVHGVRILRHAETPGLGANYAAPDVLTAFYVGHGLDDRDWRVAKDGGQVDAITGATVTGRAIADAVVKGLERYRDDQAELFGGAEVRR